MSKEISTSEDTSISEGGILSEIFSSHAVSLIVDFFLDHKEFDYSPSEIAQKTGLSFRTVFREIPNLEKYQLIYNSRRIGKTNMYILNSDNDAIKFLERFALEMLQYCDSKRSITAGIPKEENNQLYEEPCIEEEKEKSIIENTFK